MLLIPAVLLVPAASAGPLVEFNCRIFDVTFEGGRFIEAICTNLYDINDPIYECYVPSQPDPSEGLAVDTPLG